MNEQMNIWEMKAEMLLHRLYPEWSELWIAENRGTFYRNYSPDLMEVDEDTHTVSVSRDGFLRLLPQGLIATGDELKGGNFKQRYEELRRRRADLEDLFRPVDSLEFRKGMRVEAQVAELLEEKLDFLLKRYFHCNRSTESNAYVRELMGLLPYASRLRGNFNWICEALAALLKHRVTMRFSRYDWSEWTRDSQPLVQYQVWISGLQGEAYRTLEKEVRPLHEFICEWFIPFDTRCRIEIKEEHRPVLNERLILNYNTRLTNPQMTE